MCQEAQVTPKDNIQMRQKPHFSHKDSRVVKSYYRVYKRVFGFFNDSHKATEWMFTPNMWLGGISPLDMIDAGRDKKLENWIISQLDENEPQTTIPGFVK